MYMQFALGGSAMHISACIGSMCFPTECGLARVARRGDGQFVIRPQGDNLSIHCGQAQIAFSSSSILVPQWVPCRAEYVGT